jgi:hypothetical protein
VTAFLPYFNRKSLVSPDYIACEVVGAMFNEERFMLFEDDL